MRCLALSAIDILLNFGRLLAETLSVDVNALIFSASQAARLKMDRPFDRFIALS